MDKYILRDENAIFFECGFSCDNAIFVKLGSEAYFVTDARYSTEAKQFAKKCEIIESSDLTKTVKSLLRTHKIQKIFFDSKEFTHAQFLALSKNCNTKFTDKKDISKTKRIIKTSQEIEILKNAAKMGRDAFGRLGRFLQSFDGSLNERQIFAKAKMYLSNDGQNDLSFEPITAINANAAKPHALPDTNTNLQKNDLLLIDAGLKFGRYCSDRTVTICTDDSFDIQSRAQKFKNQQIQKVYDLVYDAQMKAIECAKSGMKASQIDKIARDIISDGGYSKFFIHSLGHGVGLDIHELPVISSRSDTVIEDGMVFTIEPGIYLPNEFGVRIEDMVVMKNGRAEIL